MKYALAVLIGASLSLMVFASGTALAQLGGVPSLGTRVQALEVEVPELEARVGTLAGR